MSRSKFVTQETTKTVTDSWGRTIEITQSKVIKTKGNEEPFFMVYCKQLAPLYDLTSASAIKVLVKFMETATFNEGRVSLTAGLRNSIANNLKISSSSLTKAISILLDSGLISEVYEKSINYDTGEETLILCRGEYFINPAILWKGDSSERKKLLNANCVITITPEFEEEVAN